MTTKIITHSGQEFDTAQAYQQHTVERIKQKCPDAVIRSPRDYDKNQDETA